MPMLTNEEELIKNLCFYKLLIGEKRIDSAWLLALFNRNERKLVEISQ